MSADPTPRWIYRFRNFSRAVLLLREAMSLAATRPLTDLELEGVVQRFEYVWELAWNLMKDFLEAEGVVFTRITPSEVLKAALAAKLIDDGEVWMRGLDTRNKMAHVYNQAAFQIAVERLKSELHPAFERLYADFVERAAAHESAPE